MEPANPTAPPVVAVMVVNEPGPWFDDTLDGLAHQDYTNLKLLFLLAGEPGGIPARIRAKVPGAFVRAVTGNPGFGAAANEVLELVEGDNGFFCFLHDDTALDPTAIRLLVEELYRSNAGIVGPKLVTWDDPGVLQHVGLAVDRFGEVDPLVEPGEVDQEQHDAVRDVFALPTACLLMRADLFRALGGFDPTMTFYGEDVDLCWRAHLGGARVVVVPPARARHRERLAERRPTLHHTALQARNRMRTVATLTGARRLPLVLVQMVIVTLAELLVGVVTGKPRQAWSSFTALIGLIPRIPAVVARRRRIAALREVPSSEVAGLQLRGSARLSSYMRSRDTRGLDPDATTERRWRQTAGSAPTVAWLAVLAAAAIGSRSLIGGGIPAFGEFLQFPHSPGTMLADYRSGWWGHGLGSSSPVPTGIAIISVGSAAALFHMGLWHTACVLGLLVIGYAGMWRLATLFPTPRARISALVVYAALPLPGELLSAGRWSALACYAAMPWVVHLLRRSAGIETIGSAGSTEVERYAPVAVRRRVRLLAQLSLVCAVTIAFTPSFVLVAPLTALVLALTTVLARGSLRPALVVLASGVLAAAVGVVANLPWSASLVGSGGWDALVGPRPAGAPGLGVGRLAGFGVGAGRHAIVLLAIALYLPVVAAPLVARGWRLTWAVRAAGLVFGFGWLAVLADRGSIGLRLPEAGVLLAPVAVGVALSAACIAAAFQDDVLSGSFGWRQPLGVLSSVAVVIGVLPGVLSIGSGRWRMPSLTLSSVLGQLPTDPAEGDYRILWVGDTRVMPVGSWTFEPGISYAITDDGPLQVDEAWPGRPGAEERSVVDVLHAAADESTLRVGRLLAPFAIRYIVVPVADGAISSIGNPLPLPSGLVDALEDQLDLAQPPTRPLNYLVFENTAWTPTRGLLNGSGADASKLAGDEALAQADVRGSLPFAVGARDRGPADGEVRAGTVHVAVPFDEGWSLTVDGTAVPARRAFGTTMAFDAPAGRAHLAYDTPASRVVALAAQLVVWLALVLAASRVSVMGWVRRRRRPSVVGAEGPVLVLDRAIVEPAGTGGLPWRDESATDPSPELDDAVRWQSDDDPATGDDGGSS